MRSRPDGLSGQASNPRRSPSSSTARLPLTVEHFGESGRRDRRPRAGPPVSPSWTCKSSFTGLCSGLCSGRDAATPPPERLNTRLCGRGYFPVNRSTVVLRNTYPTFMPASNGRSVHRPLGPLLRLGGSTRFAGSCRPQCPRPQTLATGSFTGVLDSSHCFRLGLSLRLMAHTRF